MGAVVALIAVLVVMISGFSVGLVRDGVSGLQRLPATSLAFADGVQRDAAFSRSLLDLSAVRRWSTQPGVERAEPFGTTLVNARSNSGVEIDLALFGVRAGSWMAPPAAEGAPLGDAHGLLVSKTAIDAGLRVGDTVTVDRIGTRLTVIGALADQHTFGHVDVAYLPLRTWQEIRAGVRPGERPPDGTYDTITAVAVSGTSVDLAVGDRSVGTTSLTREQSYDASPGYTAETSTLDLIKGFLYAISALVVGAFFTVWTIQRRQEIAVLRAMGAPTGYLLRDGLGQALVLLGLAIGAGVGLGTVTGGLIGDAVPFALDAAAVATAAVLLLVLGLAGAAVAVVRIAAVDPLIALGAQR